MLLLLHQPGGKRDHFSICLQVAVPELGEFPLMLNGWQRQIINNSNSSYHTQCNIQQKYFQFNSGIHKTTSTSLHIANPHSLNLSTLSLQNRPECLIFVWVWAMATYIHCLGIWRVEGRGRLVRGVEARGGKETKIVLTFGFALWSSVPSATHVPNTPFFLRPGRRVTRETGCNRHLKVWVPPFPMFPCRARSVMAFPVPGKQGDLGLTSFLLKAADINAEEREGPEERERSDATFTLGLEWLPTWSLPNKKKFLSILFNQKLYIENH